MSTEASTTPATLHGCLLGELTRTNKVRRGFIAEKYLPLVDALYGGLTTQFIETVVKFEDGRSGSVSATLNISDAQTFVPVKAAA